MVIACPSDDDGDPDNYTGKCFTTTLLRFFLARKLEYHFEWVWCDQSSQEQQAQACCKYDRTSSVINASCLFPCANVQMRNAFRCESHISRERNQKK